MKLRCSLVIACLVALNMTCGALAQTTTVVAHGYSSGSKGVWVQGMCEAALARAGGSGSVYRYTGATGVWTYVPEAGGDGSNDNIVLIFNWVPESDGVPPGASGANWNYTQAAGDVLYAMLRDAKYAAGQSGPGDLVTGRALHLIGHSRGAIVMSEAARRFAIAGITVDQLTTLDPHPVDGTLDAPYNLNWNDPTPPGKWSTTNWADNYWRADGGGIINGLDFDGIPLANAFNTLLSESALNNGGYGFAHLDVHLWYHGTIDLSPTPCDGEQCITAQMRSTWWQQPGGYTQAGYYYSVIGGGSAFRPALGPGVVPSPDSAPILYNGDFALNTTSQASYAAWAAHGGSVSGGAQITTESGNGYLRLGPGASASTATHNRFFLPADADELVFDYRVYTPGSGPVEQLEARLLDEDGGPAIVIGSIALNAVTAWIHGHTMQISPGVPRARNYRLQFAIASAGSIEAVTGVDDIVITQAPLPPLCPADLNGSGSVDIDDLLAVINAWGSTGAPGTVPGDVNQSGTTDIDDLLLVINAWGMCG